MSDLVTQEWELPSPVCPGGKILQGLSSVPAPETLTSVLRPGFSRARAPSPPLDSVGCHTAREKFLFRFK